MKRELGEQLGLHWMHVWLEQEKKSTHLSQQNAQPANSPLGNLPQEKPNEDTFPTNGKN